MMNMFQPARSPNDQNTSEFATRAPFATGFPWAKRVLAAAITASLLAACGGGGGGGGAASATSRGITKANQKQVVAAALSSLETTESLGNVAGTDDNTDAKAAASTLSRAKHAISKLRATKAREEVESFCASGHLWVDDETGEEIYENCVLAFADIGVQFNGTITTQDFSDDPAAAYDLRIAYDNFSLAGLLSDVDRITSTFNGEVLSNYTDTTEHADTDLRFETSYVCRGATGGYGGAYRLTSDIEVLGDESVYSENGTLTITGYAAFSGNLTVTTVEPFRYRDGFNDNNPYTGRVRFAADDGSAVEITFAEGGLYLDGEFFTWAQYEEQFVPDNALAACLQN